MTASSSCGLEAAQHGGEASSRDLREALSRAIAAPDARDDLRIEAECRAGQSHQSVRVYGSGVGIWQRRAQFVLDEARLTALLRAFDRHDFFSLEESYGGRKGIPLDAQGIRITCRVSLSLARADRRVTQLAGGEQSATLTALASEIVEICLEPARHGITTRDLPEGLASVASGQLAPEVLALVGHFKPEHGAGWLLEIRDGELRSQVADTRAGYGPRKRLRLSRQQVRTLAGALVSAGVHRLPTRLALKDYTELRLEVLDKQTDLLARPLAGAPAPTAHQREVVGRVLQDLERLHRLAMTHGTEDS